MPLFTLALTEGLRVWFGTSFIGAANTIYGILLILFIIFMPKGIVGTGIDWWRRMRTRTKLPLEVNEVT